MEIQVFQDVGELGSLRIILRIFGRRPVLVFIKSMEALIYCGGMVLVSIPITACICRFRLAQKKQVYWGAVLAGAFFASLSAFIAMSVYSGQVLESFRPGSLLPAAKSPGALLIIMVPAFLCVPPAMVVVAFYQRKGSK